VSQSTNFFNEHLLETINYFYDANKKMIQSTIFTPDNSIIDTINFHWDINGNLIKKSAYVYRLYNNEYKAKYFEESFKYYDSYKNYLFNMQLPEIYMLYHNYYSGTIDANVSNNLLKEHVNVTDNSTIVYDVISNVDSLPTELERNIIDSYGTRSSNWNIKYEKLSEIK
ncbi:MAG: hypothetical protein PHG64_12605, partial [Paludibacter sp.]|nr:hypothetical protein [Paludibacter sp.]